MGRLWLKNHNLHYSSYFFEETLFTLLQQGDLLLQMTCLAYCKATEFKHLLFTLLGICDRLLA